jgi:hypothetical protein
MGTNNVFIIPANLVHQELQAGSTVSAGFGGLNNVNMFLSSLGLGLGGGINPGCGGGISLPHGLGPHLAGQSLGAQVNMGRFSCPSCSGGHW